MKFLRTKVKKKHYYYPLTLLEVKHVPERQLKELFGALPKPEYGFHQSNEAKERS